MDFMTTPCSPRAGNTEDTNFAYLSEHSLSSTEIFPTAHCSLLNTGYLQVSMTALTFVNSKELLCWVESLLYLELLGSLQGCLNIIQILLLSRNVLFLLVK